MRKCSSIFVCAFTLAMLTIGQDRPCALMAAEAVDAKSSEPQAEPTVKKRVPEKYEMPFTATDRKAALAWQAQAKKRLFELVAAQMPRHTLDERPLDFIIDSSADRGAYTLYHASLCCNDGERRQCLWAVPKGEGPFPAVLCLHGHGTSAEKVFDHRTYYRGFAEHFAGGGYCVLAPSFPHRDYAASTLWDLIRCIDIMSTQKNVDSERIGVMGHSMGGEWAMWLAACDERLKVAVVSGWMCTTEGVFSVPNCPCWELPGLVNLMDICEVHLLIAPRPVFFISAEKDECFPIKHVREGYARIRAGYRVFAAEEACAQDIFSGGHMVNGKVAFPFVDKILGGHCTGSNQVEQ